MNHKPLTSLVLVILLIVTTGGSSLGAPPVPAAAWQSKVDPWVLTTAAAGQTEFLVFLAEQADLSAAAALPTKLEKGRYVYETLVRTAGATQGPVIAALEALGLDYQPFWVANMIWVRGDAAALEALASRADVAHLYANPTVKLAEPAQPAEAQAPAGPQAPEAVEWNITKVNAPAVWAKGYTGQGAVVAGQDTGYQWDHPALKGKYRGWNGTAASHDYNWHDAIHVTGSSCGADSLVPCDDDGHGTHTMGTMVGDDGAGNQIGMAPGAQWIGCRNMNAGAGTPTTYAECYQWFIAPTKIDRTAPDPSKAPDVINNSWGCPASEGCTSPNVLLTVVQNVRAAGIVTVHSAGNSGSSCGTVSDPAAIYAESFSVGATNSSDAIASFSSRGPVTADGSNRLKPNVSAPGVGIRSSVPTNSYQDGWSGTSMAGPHVAGLVALLISANPAIAGRVNYIEDVIEQSAVHLTSAQTCGGVSGSTIPNNTYGWGRIDALAAYNLAPTAIALASFSAAAQGAAVEVTWETVSEIGNAGFNLYRATSAAGPGVKLNAALIPSQAPGSSSGSSYSYVDRANLAPGTTYTYWLEDVSQDGVATRHEPVSVTYTGAPTAVSLAALGALPALSVTLPAGGLALAAGLAALAGLARRRRR